MSELIDESPAFNHSDTLPIVVDDNEPGGISASQSVCDLIHYVRHIDRSSYTPYGLEGELRIVEIQVGLLSDAAEGCDNRDFGAAATSVHKFIDLIPLPKPPYLYNDAGIDPFDPESLGHKGVPLNPDEEQMKRAYSILDAISIEQSKLTRTGTTVMTAVGVQPPDMPIAS